MTSEKQVGWALLRHAGFTDPRLAQLWTLEAGPTAAAFDLLEGKGSLSPDRLLLLRIAIDVWNARGDATFGSAFRLLDEKQFRAVSRLLAMVAGGGETESEFVEGARAIGAPAAVRQAAPNRSGRGARG